MEHPPGDLTDEMVTDWLRNHWAIESTGVSYAPVGFGSHHWIGLDQLRPRWFVKMDQLADASDRPLAKLRAITNVTKVLAAHGHEYVLPPLPSETGHLVVRVHRRWAMQVYPHISGRSTEHGTWDDPNEHAAVAAMIGRLHAVAPLPPLTRWNFEISPRGSIERILVSLSQPWEGGPYAEPARALLVAARQTIVGLLDQYDSLANEIEADPTPFVLTHGEPKSDNLIRATSGRRYLIDWDSAMLAPRERDLARLLPGPGNVLPVYKQAAGSSTVRASAIDLFELWWKFQHIQQDTRRFQRPHQDTPTNAWFWNRLCDTLQV